MARTRGSSHVIHADDGELVDKEGKPIPVNVPGKSHGTPQPIAEIVPSAPVEPPREWRWRCDRASVARNIEAWEVFCLLDFFMGGFSSEVSEAEFDKLSPDLKRHFRRL